MTSETRTNGYEMTGKTKRPGVYNVIPKPDGWAWKTKRILEHPNSDNEEHRTFLDLFSVPKYIVGAVGRVQSAKGGKGKGNK